MAVNGIWSLALFEIRRRASSVYPGYISSSNSRELNQILNKLLRQDAGILREFSSEGAESTELQAKKNFSGSL